MNMSILSECVISHHFSFSDPFRFYSPATLSMSPASHNTGARGGVWWLQCITFTAPRIILVSHSSICCVCVCVRWYLARTDPTGPMSPDTQRHTQSCASCSPLLQGIEYTSTTSWAHREREREREGICSWRGKLRVCNVYVRVSVCTCTCGHCYSQGCSYVHVHGPVHLSVCVGVRVCLCVSVRLFQRVTLINAHPAFIPLCLRTEKKQNTKKYRERERVGGVGVGWG